MRGEPPIAVGILTGGVVDFEGNFDIAGSAATIRGPARASAAGGRLLVESGGERSVYPSGLRLTPRGGDRPSFVLRGVTIGKQFHWERKEDQRFTGDLKLLADGEEVVAVNVVPLEVYLSSVISSEMSAGSSLNLLKAHAVASRSWLLAWTGRRSARSGAVTPPPAAAAESACRVRWYDRQEHNLFDVCADDHCQRYQGITKSWSPAVRRAVDETRGEVLTYDGRICDARFSKSCGGITEPFGTVWQPVDLPYLVSVADIAPSGRRSGSHASPDVSSEDRARRWIRSSPAAFCNTADRRILSHVLPGYDRETADFFRWKVVYAQDQIAALIREKSGVDFGAIRALLPVRRGPSGRLALLQIVGEKGTMTIGKELEIRRTLSPTHLYSSAFVVDGCDPLGGIPRRFVLTGAGWGHGVGLCQIGAAVMGARGYAPWEILQHYFPGTTLARVY